MDTDRILPSLAIVGLLVVLSTSLYGIAALWAVSGRCTWLWRIAPLALLLAALAPIGAYELLALYGTQTAVVVVAISLARFTRRCSTAWRDRGKKQIIGLGESRRPARSTRLQFLLPDVLKAVLLAAGVFALVRNAAPSTAATVGVQIDWWPWVAIGLAFGGGTLAAAWTAFGRSPWYFRVITLVLVALAGACVLEVFETPRNVAKQFDPFGGLLSNPQLSIGWGLLCASLQVLVSAISLWLVRRAGWNFSSPGRHLDSENATVPPNSTEARDRLQWLAQAAVCGCSLLVAGISIIVFFALLPPAIPSPEPLPVPNGYDDFVTAGTGLNWTSIPNEDFEVATIAACQAFLQTNARSLSLMRQAFAKPSRVPGDFTNVSFTLRFPDISTFRSLCRALSVEGKIAVSARKSGDAVQSYLDMIRLGQKLSYGGLAIHELVDAAIERVGVQGMVAQWDQLDATNLALLGPGLERLVDSQEPLEKIIEREWLWDRLAYGWVGRLSNWAERTMATDNGIIGVLPEIRRRNVAQLRLLVVEAAVRRHALVEGSPPESLVDLVPKYLSAVPQDPFGDGPLTYRRTHDGYLLYSVGANRTDDGGQRVSLYEATTEKKGDLFFDASPEMPEETGDTDEGAADAGAQDGAQQGDEPDKPMEDPRAGSPSP